MKKCFKCDSIQPLSNFYKHKEMLDGYLNKCKECTKRDSQQNRLLKIDYYRAYDRARGNRQSSQYTLNWRKKNLAKYQAQTLVGNLLRAKKIKKQPCEVCGKTKSHAHHDDYSKPFDVRWLCAAHHSEWHKENGEGKNGNIDLKDYGIISINNHSPK